MVSTIIILEQAIIDFQDCAMVISLARFSLSPILVISVGAVRRHPRFFADQYGCPALG